MSEAGYIDVETLREDPEVWSLLGKLEQASLYEMYASGELERLARLLSVDIMRPGLIFVQLLNGEGATLSSLHLDKGPHSRLFVMACGANNGPTAFRRYRLLAITPHHAPVSEEAERELLSMLALYKMRHPAPPKFEPMSQAEIRRMQTLLSMTSPKTPDSLLRYGKYQSPTTPPKIHED